MTTATMSNPTTSKITVHTRWTIRRDMPEVLKIERTSLLDPWTDDDFVRVLRQRNCIGMVAEHDNRVVGTMVYELLRTSINVLNFAVHPHFRRRNVGRQMIAKLLAKLTEQRRCRLTLDCRDDNVDAHLFFKAMGFRATAVMDAFYNNDQDAYHFVLNILTAEVTR